MENLKGLYSMGQNNLKETKLLVNVFHGQQRSWSDSPNETEMHHKVSINLRIDTGMKNHL